jgi:ABC-2 type transport system ATP-binding protein
VVALDGVSLEIQAGEIFGLLGPNGAGKTTTVGVLTTRVRPTAGRAWIHSHDVWADPVAVKRLIGVVPQQANLDFALTAREILVFHGAYFGQGASERAERADRLLEKFQLAGRADDLPQSFSGGMAQRLSIARALMHDPQVLFLDEPSAGLDPQTRLLLWELVREYNAAGRTVLLTTHYMEEADALCDRIAIIDHGRIIAMGTPEDLKASVPGGHVVRLRFSRDPRALVPAFEGLEGVREVRATEDPRAGPAAGPDTVADWAIDVYGDVGGPLVPKIASLAAGAAAGLHDVHLEAPSLETLFLHHTGRSLRE